MVNKKYEWTNVDIVTSQVIQELLEQKHISLRQIEKLTDGKVAYSRMRDIITKRRAPVRLSEFFAICIAIHADPIKNVQSYSTHSWQSWCWAGARTADKQAYQPNTGRPVHRHDPRRKHRHEQERRIRIRRLGSLTPSCKYKQYSSHSHHNILQTQFLHKNFTTIFVLPIFTLSSHSIHISITNKKDYGTDGTV